MTTTSVLALMALGGGAVDAFGPATSRIHPARRNTRISSLSTSDQEWQADSFSFVGDDGDDFGQNAVSEDLYQQEQPKKRRGPVMMSQSLPFLACPEALIDCDLAGNVGFDPLGLARNKEQLMEYREAEVKHGRLAMLAAVGWPASELYDRKIASWFDMPSVLDETDRAPSLLNGGLEKISPTWWGCCLGFTAAIDLYGIEMARSGDPDYFPGKLDFDPLGLYPSDKAGQKRMQLAEAKHGRLGMLAVVGYAAQEGISNLGVVDETPQFF